jgi:sulfite reductase beta subunit-like hemoprotein
MGLSKRVSPEELEREGLGSVDVMIRMAGCPNGCSRPPTAEIGIVGTLAAALTLRNSAFRRSAAGKRDDRLP